MWLGDRSSCGVSGAILMGRGQALTEWAARAPRVECRVPGPRAPRRYPRAPLRAPIQHRIPNIYQYVLNVIIVIPGANYITLLTTSRSNYILTGMSRNSGLESVNIVQSNMEHSWLWFVKVIEYQLICNWPPNINLANICNQCIESVINDAEKPPLT